jgi:hypothetical protein
VARPSSLSTVMEWVSNTSSMAIGSAVKELIGGYAVLRLPSHLIAHKSIFAQRPPGVAGPRARSGDHGPFGQK